MQQARVDPARIAAACAALVPLVRAAKQLLRRKTMSTQELARAVRGLGSWAAAHSDGWGAIDVALQIATGADAFEIVRKATGTRRTPAQIKAVYQTWLATRPRSV